MSVPHAPTGTADAMAVLLKDFDWSRALGGRVSYDRFPTLLPRISQPEYFVQKKIADSVTGTVLDIDPMDPSKFAEMVNRHLPTAGLRNRRIETMMRDYDASDQDTVGTTEMDIPKFLDRVRRTIGYTLYECRRPAPDALPDAIQRRITQTLRLVWYYETVENYVNDLDIIQDRDRTLRWFEYRLTRESSRMSSVLMSLLRRVTQDFDYMRELERQLRGELAEPDDGDAYESHDLWDGVIQTAFDAALSLEANFESRLFDAREEAAA